jgi:putative ABC transport system permease protein
MMRQIGIILSEFLLDLRAHKLRSFLTIFGIIWGTVAIVVLLAFGMGFKKRLTKQFHGLGEHIVIMWPGQTTRPYAGFGIGRPVTFIESDADLLRLQVRDVTAVSQEYIKWGTPVRVGQNIVSPAVTGIIPIYGEIRNIIPELGGRFINDLDITLRRRVIVLGNEVKTFLFGEENAIGKLVYVGNVPFTVVGVMLKKDQDSSYAQRDKDRVFIPASTFSTVFGITRLNNIIFQVADAHRSEEIMADVRRVLSNRYRFDPEDKDAVPMWDTTMMDAFASNFFLAFNSFLGLIGSFTLAVAGLGVANIMFIVVQERTSEIGVKRAVGARKRDILLQVFLETCFIVFIGSAIGFGIAVGVIEAMQHVPIDEFVGKPVLSVEVAVATVGVLTLISLLAGLMPARRAANLDVVECLRA